MTQENRLWRRRRQWQQQRRQLRLGLGSKNRNNHNSKGKSDIRHPWFEDSSEGLLHNTYYNSSHPNVSDYGYNWPLTEAKINKRCWLISPQSDSSDAMQLSTCHSRLGSNPPAGGIACTQLQNNRTWCNPRLARRGVRAHPWPSPSLGGEEELPLLAARAAAQAHGACWQHAHRCNRSTLSVSSFTTFAATPLYREWVNVNCLR